MRRITWVEPGLVGRTAIALLAGSVAVYGTARLLAYSATRYGAITPDGVTYLAAVERWLSGGPVYTASQHAPYLLTDASWGIGFVYPPTALPVVSVLGVVGVEAWRLLNMAALVTVALLIVRRERGRLSVTAGLATFAYLAINPFIWSAWANAQITPLLGALMAVGYVYPRIAGPAAAIGALVKIYPGAMLLWAFRERRLAGVRDSLLVGLALLVLSWPFVGHLWVDFLVAARNAYPSCNVGDPDSIRCMVGEPHGQLVAFALGGSLGLLSLAIRDRRVAFAVLMFGVMVTSPDLNWAYWILPSIGLLPALAGMTPALRLPRLMSRRDTAPLE